MPDDRVPEVQYCLQATLTPQLPNDNFNEVNYKLVLKQSETGAQSETEAQGETEAQSKAGAQSETGVQGESGAQGESVA